MVSPNRVVNILWDYCTILLAKRKGQTGINQSLPNSIDFIGNQKKASRKARLPNVKF
jgi:hypothetical protein